MKEMKDEDDRFQFSYMSLSRSREDGRCRFSIQVPQVSWVLEWFDVFTGENVPFIGLFSLQLHWRRTTESIDGGPRSLSCGSYECRERGK